MSRPALTAAIALVAVLPLSPSWADAPPPPALTGPAAAPFGQPQPAGQSSAASAVAPPAAETQASSPTPASRPSAIRPMELPASLPDNFQQLDKAEQLRLLQEQLDVYELYNLLAQKRKSILENMGFGTATAAPAAALPSPPVNTGTTAPSPNRSSGDIGSKLNLAFFSGGTGFGPQPTVQRIHVKSGQRVAEIQIPNMGVRSVHRGSELPDGRHVVDITAEDVIVADPGQDGKTVALGAQAGTPPMASAPPTFTGGQVPTNRQGHTP
ncbi:hypothetical protein CWS72_26995 [Telmatospirillum siberiense]|uniref:Type IV pilus biogenesis protein PilP n=2 Tax=Telmatospirillum siberiense TaxID=382514 RepID=A0A2N3PLX5_9PROT|nr:hypothetical protein CWS72_26995 [Telmatospirillum siberiense]